MELGEREQRSPASALYLIVHAPDGAHALMLDDGDELVAGRARDADITIADPGVSRLHARFRRAGSVVEVEDLGTRNGTWLDGRRVDGKSPVPPGISVRIGDARIGVAVCAEVGRQFARGSGELAELPPGAPLVVADPIMQRLYDEAQRIARTACTVLITGETGVGKELVAEHIHGASPRAGGPFLRVNCAAVPEALLESELFGYDKGAFTGADRRREGWLEAAHGGTLFLDEIGEMPAAMQAKLLRALDSGKIFRLGSSTEIPIDVRVLCATHRDLEAAVAAGTFRADLYYRVSTVVLAVPPLRDRPSEITLLAHRFLAAFAARSGVAPPVIDVEACAFLQRHRWPGNVRELRNAIERAMVLQVSGTITVEDLPDTIREGRSITQQPVPQGLTLDGMRDQIADLERATIAAVLDSCGGSQTEAAKKLGISRRTLIYRMEKHGLKPPPTSRRQS